MTAEQLLTADLPSLGEPPSQRARWAELIRTSFTQLEPHADELSRTFYATLFARAPATRAMFPVNMQIQRSRLLRALMHIVQLVDQPDELVPFLEQLGRDHRKFGVLTEHYTAVGSALLEALGSLAGPRWTDDVRQAWSQAYRTVADAMRIAADTEQGPATWPAHVTTHRRIGWDLAVVTLAPQAPIPYRAGQYLSVETPQRPRLWRYLSPANAPRPDGQLEFHVRAVAGGWVSPAIVAHTQIGDTWRIGPPMGRMQIDPDSGRDLLMIAGGTGYAPIRALLQELIHRRNQPTTHLFLGGRTRQDLYDLPTLRELCYHHPWLDVVPVLEHTNNNANNADDAADDADGPAAERGTLADVITRYGAWTDHDVLVCGSPAMIRSTVSRMLVAGTPLDRIRYDPFTVD